MWRCLDSSKTTERNVTGLEIDKVIRIRHERPVHHDTLCIALFVVISSVIALSTAVLISGKLIWLTCQTRKCLITVTRSCWKVFKLCMGWAAEARSRRVYSQNLCKNSKQRRVEDVVFVTQYNFIACTLLVSRHLKNIPDSHYDLLSKQHTTTRYVL